MEFRICDRITKEDCMIFEDGETSGYYSFAVECGMLWLRMTKEEKEKIMRNNFLCAKNASDEKLTKEEMQEWIDLMSWEFYHGITVAVIPACKIKF